MTGAAAYVRVSSRSQDLASQKDAIAKMANARGDKVDVWYEEKRSAAKLARPELDRVREIARLGGIRKLYVFRLDRLARSGIRDTLGLLEELNANGCQVVSVADGFELGGVAGDVVVAVMAWAAEMERLALGERISAARARVEAKGGRWGRPARVGEKLVSRIRAAKGTVRALSQRFKVPRSTVGEVLSGKGAYAAKKKRPIKAAPKKR